jgi:hypothetical protein
MWRFAVTFGGGIMMTYEGPGSRPLSVSEAGLKTPRSSHSS